MKTNVVCILITIIAYLLMMVLIGIRASRKNNDVGDFYLGGRKLGPIVTAMSAEASDMSSYLLMGLPGLAYLTGLCDVGWTVIGLAAGTYLNWLLTAKRLRIYSHKLDAITIPEFFSKRYREKSNVIMGISALIILIFFIPYTASGFAACGKLFGTLFGWDYHFSMFLSALIIIAYTSIGGFLAASTTDLIQSIAMTAALIIMIVFGIGSAGGLDVVLENAKGLSGYLSLSELHNPETGTASHYGPVTVVSTLAWGLGYFGMPHILLRFMAIEDSEKIKVSRRIASIWVVISMAIAIYIGIIGNALSASGKIETLSGNDSETVIMKMATLMSENGILAALFAGLIFAGILACTMSTSDSQLLAASSSMSENFIKGVFRVKLTDKQSMLIARLVLVFIAVISVFIAWNPDSSVFKIVSFAWAGFGATFGPLMIASLFWKRSNKYGAVACLVTGAVTVFVWKFCVRPLGGSWDIYELLPAFIAGGIAMVIVSLITSKPENEITADFEAVNKEIKA